MTDVLAELRQAEATIVRMRDAATSLPWSGYDLGNGWAIPPAEHLDYFDAEDRDLIVKAGDELLRHALDDQLGPAHGGPVALRNVEDAHGQKVERRR